MVLDSEPSNVNEEEGSKPENTYQDWFEDFIHRNDITLDATYTVVAFIDFTSTPFRETSSRILNLMDSSMADNMLPDLDSKRRSPPELNRLKVYCDANDCILYLSISLNLNINDLNILSEVKETGTLDKDILSVLEYQIFRTLLFMFLISDVVVILNDSKLLTTNIISTLRLLSSLKRKIFPLLTAFEEKLFSGDADKTQLEIRRGLGQFIRKVPVISFVFHDIPSAIRTHDLQYKLESRIKLLFCTFGLLDSHDHPFKYDGRQLFVIPRTPGYNFVHFAGWKTESSPVMDLMNHYFCTPGLKKLSWEETGQDDCDINFDHIDILRDRILEWAKKSYELSSKSRRNRVDNSILEIGCWITTSGFLYSKIFLPASNTDRKKSMEEAVYRKLKEYIELDRHVSSSHCRQAMNKTVDWYVSACPPHYTKQLHEHKLNQALHNYRSMARGPCSNEFLNGVKRECQKYWENGHQKCEVRSLTGHECGLSNIHGTGKDGSRGGSKRDAKHKSPFQALHACNCGRSRRVREDPFSLREANYGFFKIPECCNNDDVISYEFPAEPSGIPMWSLVRIGPNNFYRPLFGLEKWDGFIGNCNFLTPWWISSDETSVSQSEFKGKDSNEDNVNKKDQEKYTRKPIFDDKPRSYRKSKRDRGLRYGREGRSKPNGYLGMEYECPLGHRFLSCGDGRVCKLGHTEMEEAHALIEQDFPIYITCPCSNTTDGPPVNAQLQRVIIVTPNSPISCVLSPTVKIESEEREISVPLCKEEGFKLPKDSFVVLRLPYIYYDGKIAISPPSEGFEGKFYLAKHFLSTQSSDAS